MVKHSKTENQAPVSDECCQTFKTNKTKHWCKQFLKKEEERKFQLLFYEISIIVLPKADKKILRKENHKNDYPSWTQAVKSLNINIS